MKLLNFKPATLEEIQVLQAPENAKPDWIYHGDLLVSVLKIAESNGLKLTSQKFLLGHGTNSFFGELVFALESTETQLVIGIRNALSKSSALLFGVSLKGAPGIFYAADIAISKRILRSGNVGFSNFLEETVNGFIRNFDKANALIKHWKSLPLTPNAAASHVFQLEDSKAIGPDGVSKGYWNFAGKIGCTVWEFFHSMLDSSKNPIQRAIRQSRQVGYFQSIWSTDATASPFTKVKLRKARKAKAPVKSNAAV